MATTCHDRTGVRMPEGAATYEGFETLRVERAGPVGWIVFDRSDRGNAMNARMMQELETAWRTLADDERVHVVVNTGAGTVFQTGVDLAELSRDPEALREQSRRTRDFTLRFTSWHNDVWKPVIAAVNGVVAGGGLHFVADADIVIASTAASFVDPHVSVGQASVYETIALAKKSPMGAVMRMAFTGRHERISAERAYQLGICSQVVAPGELRATAQALGEVIARNSPAALAHTKRALWQALETISS
jgi:enoyl-CoA hydratase/carnithine racemase